LPSSLKIGTTIEYFIPLSFSMALTPIWWCAFLLARGPRLASISCGCVSLLSRCNEIVECPQLDPFGNYKIFHRRSGEALDFIFTLGQQPGPCPLKVEVAIPGMTHQFRGALR